MAQLAGRRRQSVTTAVIILLQQDIDLHQLPWWGRRKKAAESLWKTAACEIPLSTSFTQTMHLSCSFRRLLHFCIPNDSGDFFFLSDRRNWSFLFGLWAFQLTVVKKAARVQSGGLVREEENQTVTMTDCYDAVYLINLALSFPSCFFFRFHIL